MSTSDHAGMERLATQLAMVRAAYLDLMRDSLIGLLNEDPPLPASKVEGYKDDYREQGWDWPSKAPSMIGAKRMDNVMLANGSRLHGCAGGAYAGKNGQNGLLIRAPMPTCPRPD